MAESKQIIPTDTETQSINIRLGLLKEATEKRNQAECDWLIHQREFEISMREIIEANGGDPNRNYRWDEQRQILLLVEKPELVEVVPEEAAASKEAESGRDA